MDVALALDVTTDGISKTERSARVVFSSQLFIFYFLPFALTVYYALSRAPQRTRNFALAVLGYIFYGWANPLFMLLMFATTFVDWFLSLIIAGDTRAVWRVWHQPITPLPRGTARTGLQHRAIVLSVVSNLAMLGFFKYFHFGVESYNSLMQALGLAHWDWDPLFRVVLSRTPFKFTLTSVAT